MTLATMNASLIGEWVGAEPASALILLNWSCDISIDTGEIGDVIQQV